MLGVHLQIVSRRTTGPSVRPFLRFLTAGPAHLGSSLSWSAWSPVMTPQGPFNFQLSRSLEFGPTVERLSTLVAVPTCSLHGNVESTGIIRYGFYRTTAGKRRRSRASGADRRSRPPYDRLQHRRATFDSVVTGSNGWPGTPSPAGSSGLPPCVATFATAGPPASSPQSCRPTRSGRSPGGRRGRRGCARRLRSGRVSGRRLSSGDPATGTPWRSFVTSRRAGSSQQVP